MTSVSLERIERNLLGLALASLVTVNLLAGAREGVSLGIGFLLAYFNLRIITRGVKTLLKNGDRKSQKRYMLLSGIKFMFYAVLLGIIFYFAKPSVLYFLTGFSLFIPAIVWETVFNSLLDKR